MYCVKYSCIYNSFKCNYIVPPVDEFIDDQKTRSIENKKIKIISVGQFTNVYYQINHSKNRYKPTGLGGCDLISLFFTILFIHEYKRKKIQYDKLINNHLFPNSDAISLIFSESGKKLNAVVKSLTKQAQIINSNKDMFWSGSHKEVPPRPNRRNHTKTARKTVLPNIGKTRSKERTKKHLTTKAAFRGKPPTNDP